MRRSLLLLLLALCAVLAWRSGLRLPDRHLPWTPLSPATAPNWLTGYKLGRFDDDPQACLRFLRQTALRFEPLEDRSTGDGCGFFDAVRIDGGPVAYTAPFSTTCRLAASIALWQRHVVQPAARNTLSAEVRRIDHYGSYACRNIDNRATGRRSEHALANAWDVAGFRLDNGDRITVASHWVGDEAGARFLGQVHDGACDLFSTTLGPAHNEAHADHFHLDARGGFPVCR
ncbi:extensin family protein [uncultured Abyssibacter sp.]|uniref:extensin-like domain-containing protein n=1 Tax=uncultured Abyssibacter sp. TaxID=2320202 RepID=UPI0032B2F848